MTPVDVPEHMLREVFPDGIPPYQYRNLLVLMLDVDELTETIEQIERTENAHKNLPINLPTKQNNDNGNIICRDGAVRQEDDATLRNVAIATKSPFGSYPANFEEAPIQPAEPEPPAPGRNKYGRYDSDIPPEIDEGIVRLREKGLDCREIAAEILQSSGIDLHYRRVQGRLSTMARKQKRRATIERCGGMAGPENVAERTNPSENVAERPCFSEKIDERILELEFDDLTPEEISAKLREDGATIPVDAITARLEELHQTPEATEPRP